MLNFITGGVCAAQGFRAGASTWGQDHAPGKGRGADRDRCTLRTSEHRSMYSYVRLSIDRCTLVRLSIDRCTATYSSIIDVQLYV